MSHLALQVHLYPTGEEQLYNISMTIETGQHEGSHTILRNTMRQNSTITVMNMEMTIESCTFAVRHEILEAVNDTTLLISTVSTMLSKIIKQMLVSK